MNNILNGLCKNKNTIGILALSSILISCGGGEVDGKRPPPLPVETMLLNDTGVKYLIDGSNKPYAIMTVSKDASGKHTLSIFGNFVTEIGERYSEEPYVDTQGVQRTKIVFSLDQNGQRIIEQIAVVQETNADGSLKFGIGPTIFTNYPNDFPDELNVVQSAPASFPGQDANFGRDIQATTNSPADGKAGFQFIKLHKDNGSQLAPDESNFGCVKDVRTGLTWENKVDSRLEQLSDYHKLHKSNARHTWYNPDKYTNGGNAGQTASATACATVENDTYNFLKAVNTEKLCGIQKWRIPTAEELRSLVDYSVKDGNFVNPMVDQTYFPFIASILHRWTSQTNGPNEDRAFGFHMHEGRMQAHEKKCTIDIKDSAGNTTTNGNQNGYHNGTILVSGVY